MPVKVLPVSAQHARSQEELANSPSIFTAEGRVICPKCEVERHINWYTHCERKAKYADDLNQVFICARNKGGCGHIFSPGNRELVSLLVAYLEGRVVLAPVDDEVKEASKNEN